MFHASLSFLICFTTAGLNKKADVTVKKVMLDVLTARDGLFVNRHHSHSREGLKRITPLHELTTFGGQRVGPLTASGGSFVNRYNFIPFFK